MVVLLTRANPVRCVVNAYFSVFPLITFRRGSSQFYSHLLHDEYIAVTELARFATCLDPLSGALFLLFLSV